MAQLPTASQTGIESLDHFLEHCHRRQYPAKSVIIYAGDKPDVLYYIVDGSVTVLIEDEEGREIVLAYLNRGDFFGEMACSRMTQIVAHGFAPVPPAKSPK